MSRSSKPCVGAWHGSHIRLHAAQCSDRDAQPCLVRDRHPFWWPCALTIAGSADTWSRNRSGGPRILVGGWIQPRGSSTRSDCATRWHWELPSCVCCSILRSRTDESTWIRGGAAGLPGESVTPAADPRRRLDTAAGFLRSFRLRDPAALGTAILRLLERSPIMRPRI